LFREEFDAVDSTNLIDELVIATDLRKVCYYLCFIYLKNLNFRKESKLLIKINL
jgi:hypothetical protein